VTITGVAKVGQFSFIAADNNPVAFNPMAAGTVVSASGTEGLAVTLQGGSPVPSTSTPTGVVIGYAFDDTTTSGVITVNLRSPSGLTTTVSQAITQGPGAGTPCP
jgi:hypothetical protein